MTEHRAADRWRSIAIRAIVCWAVIATTALPAIYLSQHKAIKLVRQEAQGLCLYTQALGQDVDDAHRVLHTALTQAGRLSGPLGKAFIEDARHVRHLASTDCGALTKHPSHFLRPKIQSFR